MQEDRINRRVCWHRDLLFLAALAIWFGSINPSFATAIRNKKEQGILLPLDFVLSISG